MNVEYFSWILQNQKLKCIVFLDEIKKISTL